MSIFLRKTHTISKYSSREVSYVTSLKAMAEKEVERGLSGIKPQVEHAITT